MGKIREDNYIMIQGWMVTELELKGNELLIFAIIHGFSQDGETRFTGGLQYLADWTNSTKQGISKNLKSLVNKGYIAKEEKIINGVKFCEYYATKFNGALNKVESGMQQSLTPMQQSLMGGMQQSLTNSKDNIINKNINSISNKNNKCASACASTCASKSNGNDTVSIPYLYRIDSKEIEKDKKKEKAYYPLDEKLNKAFADYVANRKAIKKPMSDIAIDRAIKKLDSLTNDPDEKIEILNQSIVGGWSGLYPLKKERTSSGSTYIDAINNRLDCVDKWAEKMKEVERNEY